MAAMLKAHQLHMWAIRTYKNNDVPVAVHVHVHEYNWSPGPLMTHIIFHAG